MTVPTSFGLATVVQQTEDALVAALELSPVHLEPALAQAVGTWKDEPVTIETHAYSGGRIRYARFARLLGAHLEIGNVLCIARPEYGLPILGADLVALGRDAAMFAADLSPTLPPGGERDRQLSVLATLRQDLARLPSGGALPDWCQAWFSPYALYTRVGPEQLGDALRAYQMFSHAFVNLARTARPRPESQSSIEAAHDGYAAAHRTDDKGLRLLAKMFGATWSARYISDVLFPSRTSSAC